MDIEDLYVAIRVIDPIHEGEIPHDGDVQHPAGIVVVGGLGAGEGIVSERSDGRADRSAQAGRKRSTNSTTSMDIRSL